MRSIPLSIVAFMSLGFSAVALPAAAAPVNGAISKNLVPLVRAQDNSPIIQVQYRRGGPRGGSYHDRRRGRDDGGAIAAGILGGLVLGAIIASQAQPQRSVEYCIRRYRSYDPYSRTYLGYDGYRHRCP